MPAAATPFDVTAELITADGLVSGADVRHGQQIVGRVTDMRLEERHAEITMTIADGTDLPANTTLNVELPSALGTPFVRLSEPADPQGRLTEGRISACPTPVSDRRSRAHSPRSATSSAAVASASSSR